MLSKNEKLFFYPSNQIYSQLYLNLDLTQLYLKNAKKTTQEEARHMEL